jgi:uncharacterized protein
MSDPRQAATIAFLREWLVASSPTVVVEVIETHISIVFLAGERAFKLKRAVRMAYLDFSTAPQRRDACEAELALNRRTAPDLYLGVHTITKSATGLTLDGDGDLVDAVVEMRRFDEDGVFDRLAIRGKLTRPLIGELARRVARFHSDAAAAFNFGGAAGIERVLQINEAALQAAGLFDNSQLATFNAAFRQGLEARKSVLDKRRLDGKVRRCHGDLHLRNICLVAGVPTLFDCIEFSEDLATIDVLYDLAFLLMDLWERDLRELANLALNRYFDEIHDPDGLALIPFFMALRAAVRAHVLATQFAQIGGAASTKEQALGYFTLATDLLRERQPRLIAVGGWSGSGKSTVASRLACEVEPAPGARVLSSDRMRKRHFGVAAETRLPPSAYTSEHSASVYATIRAEAARILAVGHSVIADSVFDRATDRAEIEAVATPLGVRFDGLWLSAPPAALFARVASREHDASDATVGVVARQVQHELGTMTWREIDAGAGCQETIARAAAALDL